MKRVSVIDVAREAGVAPGSVSRALNGEKHVSAELRSRVNQAAQRLGYRPHAYAQGLRLGRSNTIGMLVSDMRHPMYAGVVAAVERELTQHGRMLLLADAQGEVTRERSILDTFQRGTLDGAIISASYDPIAASPAHYEGNRLPLVLIDREVEGIDRVCLERRNGMRTTVRHLLALGHRRIALFTPALDHVPGGERIAGYADAFRQAGLASHKRYIPRLTSPLQDGAEPLLKLLDLPDPPTALVCLGTRLLSGALRALRQRGLRVPEDFSVIATGAPEMLELAHPPLSCLRMDLVGAGRAAAQLLLRRLDAPNSPIERVELETELIVRDSCGPVPAQT
ncbi:LacI family DNA-binding transcriptional regulator [Variovorax sp. Sphag1AA]|uniref:LacI family DNA-binding transcriptional regulator n=1 Tax=Variovorax sp. Sphag1AA TaxID=2587027 RepID=UPI00160767EB|nr:LacI family DNA-binding transcriptional regulator [Variovorax sp. Sphag1AA]MBB3182038.1 LacI family transcriptional regulator [Variovorax sp. Sphag1AA]